MTVVKFVYVSRLSGKPTKKYIFPASGEEKYIVNCACK